MMRYHSSKKVNVLIAFLFTFCVAFIFDRYHVLNGKQYLVQGETNVRETKSTNVINLQLSRIQVNRLHFPMVPRPWMKSKREQDVQKHKIATAKLGGGIGIIGMYYAKMKVGSKEVNLQVDTGSSTTAMDISSIVPKDFIRRYENATIKGSKPLLYAEKSSGLRGILPCTSRFCRSQHQPLRSFNKPYCSSIIPRACGFVVQYLDGTAIEGVISLVQFSLSGILKTTMAVGGILAESKKFRRPDVHGIMGMAYGGIACNPVCTVPFMDKVVQGHKIRDVFSTCMTSTGGLLTLGGYKKSMYVGKLTYVPMIKERNRDFYKIYINGMRFMNGPTINMNTRAVVDSGTTKILLSSRNFAQLRAYFQEKYWYVPGICPPIMKKKILTKMILKKRKLFFKELNDLVGENNNLKRHLSTYFQTNRKSRKSINHSGPQNAGSTNNLNMEILKYLKRNGHIADKQNIGIDGWIQDDKDIFEDTELNFSNRDDARALLAPQFRSLFKLFCFKLSTKQVKMLPTIFIKLGKVELKLPPEIYMYTLHKNGKNFKCMGFKEEPALDMNDAQVILGNSLMMKYMVVYDRENERIGFAQRSKNCGENVMSISTSKRDILKIDDVKNGQPLDYPEPKHISTRSMLTEGIENFRLSLGSKVVMAGIVIGLLLMTVCRSSRRC